MYLICGDSLFDFFLETETGPGASTYAARAGGSPMNVAIGIQRLGGRAAMLTGLSSDLLGVRLRKVLEAEGVDTSYCAATDRPTTLSLVGLDAEGSPAYQFYGEGAADTGMRGEDIPKIGADITGIHFGSYSIAVSPVGDALAELSRAQADRFQSLDPNVRPTIAPDMSLWRARIEALLPQIDLLKISAEDLAMLFPGVAHAQTAQDWLARGPRVVVVTDGGEAAHGWTRSGLSASALPPKINVVDAVGAGDTFQAALLCQLGENPGKALDDMDQTKFASWLDYAARAAAITCSRRGADMARREELA